MIWRNRPGQESEQKFNDLEKELGLGNINIEVESAFPEASQQQGNLKIVKDSGTYYLVLIADGGRFRVALTSF